MIGWDDAALIARSAARLYDEGQPIWNPQDRWNAAKRRSIERFARAAAASRLASAHVVLDLGCGSQPYEWVPGHAISLDRFLEQARHQRTPVVGDLHRLPFGDGAADFAICVASVLNYVSAAEAIAELARILRPEGTLLLHFETSTSFEHLGSERWGAPAVRISTVNAGREDTLWVYRPSYVYALLEQSGLRILRRKSFHILSALALRFGAKQQGAALLASLDRVARPLAAFADDVILTAEKA